jgi:dimethylhistidine N-methyltransferase
MNKIKTTREFVVLDTPSDSDGLLDEVLYGLQKKTKELPSKLFYDEHGSQLFNEICQLDEYYLTRTEIQIMQQNIQEMAESIGPNCMLIEYGSGSSIKTRILLDHLPHLAAYVPVDISKDHLQKSVNALQDDYPGLKILPLWADYSQSFEVPSVKPWEARKLAYFPGSTIGNFTPNQSVDFMRNIADVVGPGGGFLIGADLQKNTEVLNTAYNDAKGVTAAFNLNILTHINRLFGGNFDEDNFEHYAFYNEEACRIEMHLISKLDHTAQVEGEIFRFNKGENILTEVSYKYSLDGFADLAFQAGFEINKVWTDPNKYFSVHYLIAE